MFKILMEILAICCAVMSCVFKCFVSKNTIKLYVVCCVVLRCVVSSRVVCRPYILKNKKIQKNYMLYVVLCCDVLCRPMLFVAFIH